METNKLPGYRIADTIFQCRDIEAVKAPKPPVIKLIHINVSHKVLSEELCIEDSIANKIAGKTMPAQIRYPRKNFQVALIEGACLLPGYYQIRKKPIEVKLFGYLCVVEKEKTLWFLHRDNKSQTIDVNQARVYSTHQGADRRCKDTPYKYLHTTDLEVGKYAF